MNHSEDESLIDIDEDDSEDTSAFEDYWTIAVIDDEKLVVEVTELVLDGVKIHGKRLHVLSASSAEEGFELIKSNPFVVVALIDIVMEDSKAGFSLINKIRDDLPYHPIRLIIRTGQPGYLSREEAIASYDIDDFLEKSTLTHEHLITTLTNAIARYQEHN